MAFPPSGENWTSSSWHAKMTGTFESYFTLPGMQRFLETEKKNVHALSRQIEVTVRSVPADSNI